MNQRIADFSVSLLNHELKNNFKFHSLVAPATLQAQPHMTAITDMTDTEQAILTEGSSIALHSLTHSVAMADWPRAGHRRAVDGRLGYLDDDPS